MPLPTLVFQLEPPTLAPEEPFTSELLASLEKDHQTALNAARTALAARSAEVRALQQQQVVLTSLLAATERSWSMRLTAPLRALRRLFRPSGFDAARLIPWQQLEAVAPDTWQATGPDPQFLIPCQLPAGWLRVRLRLSSEVRGYLELYADFGDGFQPTGCIERAETHDDVALDFHVRLLRPVRAVRFDPLDGPGRFRLKELRVDPLPAPAALWKALGSKLQLLQAHGLVGRCLFRGLRMLMRGELGVFYHKLFRGLSAPTLTGPDFANLNADYQEWRRRRRPTVADRQRMAATIAGMTDPPRFSVLLPVYNVAEKHLRRAIESVRGQNYPHWELCIADDGSTSPALQRLLEEYTRIDPRIRAVFLPENRGIAAASNAALNLATGDYVALLDHDDELAEHALFRMAEAIVADRGVDVLYSDEDKLDIDGRHVEPFFKPDWSPELFLACMYTCHLGVYRTSLVREAGGFRSEYDSAQDYDLMLRLLERSPAIQHIPDVLYHWRKLPTSAATTVSAKPQAPEAGRRALQDHLERTGRPGAVQPGAVPGLHRVRYRIIGRPKVSIVIASACQPITVRGGSTYHVVRCVESIRRKSSYASYEILLVHHEDDLTPELAATLERLGVVCLPYDEPFNWSAAMNRGAATATGDHLLFLNDDMEVLTPDWLEALLEFSQQREIGAVGGKLLFPNGELQHVGVLVGELTPRHAFYRFPGPFPGYFSSNLVHRNCSAVTGACLMTRAELFHELGGFVEGLSLNYSDIDYCLKVVSDGRRVVYTPYAQLYHYESSTKAGVSEAELNTFRQRWQGKWPRDPYFNPNLSSHFVDYRIDLGQRG
jgi:GT2 family glycosyltransferase